MNTKEKTDKHIMNSYAPRLDIVLDNGKLREGITGDGTKYIDFGSGIGTNSLGFCDGDWSAAVCAQVNSLQHTSNYYYTKPQAELAEKLCEITGMSNVFFGNSGAEANECAIKLARKYSFDKYGKDRHTIITLKNSFHGRTLCTISATGQDAFHNYFFPFVEGFVHVSADSIDEMKQAFNGTVCAVLLEFIQGEGGVVPLDEAFVRETVKLCAENDVLLIADEIQTGVGRTGKFLAAEHYGVKPDVITLAKGLGGGLPIGVCLATEKCKDVLNPGTHGSTFGGNPVSCAGGLVVTEKVTAHGFLTEVSAKSEYIKNKLSLIEEVKSVSGKGLMLGIELRTKTAGDVVKKALGHGLLVLTAKEKVRLLPPLNITYEEIDKGLKILQDVLK